MSDQPDHPYGKPQQNPYGGVPNYQQPGHQQQGYQQQGYAPQQKEPQATTALVLGILSLVFCPITGPFAWMLGQKSVRAIDASGGVLGGRGEAKAGQVLGIVGTVMLAFVAFVVATMVLSFIGILGTAFTSTSWENS